ncbi:signal transduction histidine kinase [Arthrobacter stackebrandtii]|uniref:histidine kinase n=1 Tax=Arthrobacter stackebrandtii TaxID=272161 RepID=A0ABS4Z119_9MICC|nr:histidine kinase [Arthrobacter stackebrandtii]MBP2414694.1 signal transduction histidine kinase [Arthrobacter stackebrandtii]PYH01785.1 histidine kinase [Arthrobacter stackebrandtii]
MENDRPLWRSRTGLVAAEILLALAIFILTVGIDSPAAAAAVLGIAAAAALVVVIGTQLRIRTERTVHEDAVAAWAGERATQAERLRIAAELHDLVSHGLGLITVRAAAARSVQGPAGETERGQALADIEEAGRETTTELRRMLQLLREPGAAPLRPAESLADLPSIIRSAEDGGLRATLAVGDLGHTAPGVQLTVCAVVREALNNSLRHAGPARAEVELRREGGMVVVVVQDGGPQDGWQPQPGAGHGLDNLRERLALLGGTLHTSSTGQGFTLTARIPDQGRP